MYLSDEYVVNVLRLFFFSKSCFAERLKREEVEECAGGLAVVGWLSGQCVTLGCLGAQKREVSHSKESSGTQ